MCPGPHQLLELPAGVAELPALPAIQWRPRPGGGCAPGTFQQSPPAPELGTQQSSRLKNMEPVRVFGACAGL